MAANDMRTHRREARETQTLLHLRETAGDVYMERLGSGRLDTTLGECDWAKVPSPVGLELGARGGTQDALRNRHQAPVRNRVIRKSSGAFLVGQTDWKGRA